MNSLKYAAGVTAILLTMVCPVMAQTAGDLLQRCAAFETHLHVKGGTFWYDTNPDASFCAGFFTSFDALGGILDDPVHDSVMQKNLGICASSGLKATQAEAIFSRYLRVHPSRASDKPMDVVVDAIRSALPCNDNIKEKLKEDVEKYPQGLTNDCRKFESDFDRLSCWDQQAVTRNSSQELYILILFEVIEASGICGYKLESEEVSKALILHGLNADDIYNKPRSEELQQNISKGFGDYEADKNKTCASRLTAYGPGGIMGHYLSK